MLYHIADRSAVALYYWWQLREEERVQAEDELVDESNEAAWIDILGT